MRLGGPTANKMKENIAEIDEKLNKLRSELLDLEQNPSGGGDPTSSDAPKPKEAPCTPEAAGPGVSENMALVTERVDEIVALGFTRDQALVALQRNKFEKRWAVDWLMKNYNPLTGDLHCVM